MNVVIIKKKKILIRSRSLPRNSAITFTSMLAITVCVLANLTILDHFFDLVIGLLYTRLSVSLNTSISGNIKNI